MCVQNLPFKYRQIYANWWLYKKVILKKNLLQTFKGILSSSQFACSGTLPCVFKTTWTLPSFPSFPLPFSFYPSILAFTHLYCNTQNWEEHGKLDAKTLLVQKEHFYMVEGEIRRLFHDMWKSSELWISLSVTKSFLRNTAMSTWTHTACACTCSPAAQERAAAEPIFIQKAWNTAVSACIRDLLTPAPTSHIMARISHLGIIPGCFGTDHITGTLSPSLNPTTSHGSIRLFKLP